MNQINEQLGNSSDPIYTNPIKKTPPPPTKAPRGWCVKVELIPVFEGFVHCLGWEAHHESFACLENQRVQKKARREKKGPAPQSVQILSSKFADCEYRSIQTDCRYTFILRALNFQLQVQNRAAKRIRFHYRNRFVVISAENLSIQIQMPS